MFSSKLKKIYENNFFCRTVCFVLGTLQLQFYKIIYVCIHSFTGEESNTHWHFCITPPWPAKLPVSPLTVIFFCLSQINTQVVSQDRIFKTTFFKGSDIVKKYTKDKKNINSSPDTQIVRPKGFYQSSRLFFANDYIYIIHYVCIYGSGWGLFSWHYLEI